MKLHYRVTGQGPRMIILHGLYGSSDNWFSIAKNLSETYTVLLPDQRNHGLSMHDPAHSYESMAEDLLELVKDTGHGKVFLAGHSMGGKSAMLFSMKYPELIHTLTVFDISPFGISDPAHPIYYQHSKILSSLLSVGLDGKTTREEVEAELAEKTGEGQITAFLMKNLTRNEKGEFRWKLNVQVLLNNLPAIMAGIVPENGFTEPVRGFPVTFVRGSESAYLPESVLPGILKIFPAAEIITVEGAGHWLNAERPETVTAILKKQLENI